MADTQAKPLELRGLFPEFQDIASPLVPVPAFKHGVQHNLETTGRPVTAKFR